MWLSFIVQAVLGIRANPLGPLALQQFTMHTTLLFAGLSSTFQWAVFRDLTAVIFHGCHQSVVHGVFKFFCIERVAGFA